MARQGITFEQVSAVADKLAGEGRTPSIGAVRELLGTGSPNTIHMHLKTWREARPVARAEAVELPQDLRNAIAQEMQKVASAARADVQEQLVEAQAEAAELAKAGDSLEAERDQLAEQVQALTTERDTLAGKTEEQATALTQAQERIEREQNAAENARIELAKAQIKIEQNAEENKRNQAEIERLKAALAIAENARIEAEKVGAVNVSRLESANDALAAANERASKAENQVALIQGSLENLRKNHADELKKLNESNFKLLENKDKEINRLADDLNKVRERAARAEGELIALKDAAKKTIANKVQKQ